MSDPDALISTEALARQLGRDDLRIYDCTTYLDPAPPESEEPYIVRPGRDSFEAAHIPGADFLDLQGEFSDPGTPLRFMMPPAAVLEAAFGRHGIGRDVRVVLYSIASMMWATRFWWMLRSLGFEGAAVLDGGFDKWQAKSSAARPGATRPPASPRRRGRDASPTSGPCSPPRRTPDSDRQRARPPIPSGRGARCVCRSSISSATRRARPCTGFPRSIRCGSS